MKWVIYNTAYCRRTCHQRILRGMLWASPTANCVSFLLPCVCVLVSYKSTLRVQFYKLSFLFQLIIFALPLYKSPWYVWIFSFTIKLLLVAVVSLKLPLLLFFLVRSLAKVNVTSWNPNHMFYTFSPFLSYALFKVITYDQQKVLKMSTINGKGKQISFFFIIQRLGHIWFFVINWKSGSPGSISHYLSSTDLD